MPIIMLRHPIERARSVFQFDRRDITQHNHAAARGSFAEYVDWALDAPDGQIRNYQVYHLSDAPIRSNNIRYASLSEDLAQVRELLLSCRAFGLVRKFAASCAQFEAGYGAVFPQLRFLPVSLNVSPESAAGEADAIAMTRLELGEILFWRLCEANGLDLALYEFARTLFAKRVRGET